MQLDKKQNLKKIGGGLPECNKVFFRHFFGFGGFVFLFSVFLCFCFVQNSPKWLFSCILEVFCLFCSHKRPVLKCLFSSHFVFLLLSSLSKIHFFICFLSINPFLQKTLCGVSFLFLLLAFSFPKVCFFI